MFLDFRKIPMKTTEEDEEKEREKTEESDGWVVLVGYALTGHAVTFTVFSSPSSSSLLPQPTTTTTTTTTTSSQPLPTAVAAVATS